MNQQRSGLFADSATHSQSRNPHTDLYPVKISTPQTSGLTTDWIGPTLRTCDLQDFMHQDVSPFNAISLFMTVVVSNNRSMAVSASLISSIAVVPGACFPKSRCRVVTLPLNTSRLPLTASISLMSGSDARLEPCIQFRGPHQISDRT